MDSTVRTYDPSKVRVLIGALVMTGFADGTFVKINRSGDAFDKKRGADGTVDRINKSAYDFEVDFSLKGTSPLNASLSGLLATDQLTNGAIFPLTIQDLSGNSLFEAPQAWIKKDPDQDFADSLNNRSWKIDTGAAANLIGGN
jgi:hypothetical protein